MVFKNRRNRSKEKSYLRHVPRWRQEPGVRWISLQDHPGLSTFRTQDQPEPRYSARTHLIVELPRSYHPVAQHPEITRIAIKRRTGTNSAKQKNLEDKTTYNLWPLTYNAARGYRNCQWAYLLSSHNMEAISNTLLNSPRRITTW